MCVRLSVDAYTFVCMFAHLCVNFIQVTLTSTKG